MMKENPNPTVIWSNNCNRGSAGRLEVPWKRGRENQLSRPIYSACTAKLLLLLLEPGAQLILFQLVRKDAADGPVPFGGLRDVDGSSHHQPRLVVDQSDPQNRSRLEATMRDDLQALTRNLLHVYGPEKLILAGDELTIRLEVTGETRRGAIFFL